MWGLDCLFSNCVVHLWRKNINGFKAIYLKCQYALKKLMYQHLKVISDFLHRPETQPWSPTLKWELNGRWQQPLVVLCCHLFYSSSQQEGRRSLLNSLWWPLTVSVTSAAKAQRNSFHIHASAYSIPLPAALSSPFPANCAPLSYSYNSTHTHTHLPTNMI